MSANLRIWSAVAKTDPSHTKKVNQRGGFTAISAHYQVMRATEQFGPVGIGWGYTNGEPIFHDALVIVPVTVWHGERGNTFGPVYGGAEWKAGTRLDNDAVKKAATDGLTKALSHLGFNADVFLGMFDDNKYVQQVAREFAEQARDEGQSQRGAVSPHPDDPGEPNRKTGVTLAGPHKSITSLEKAIKAFAVEMGKVGDMREWYALKNDNGPLLAQAERDHPDWWNGWASQPDGFTPLRRRIEILEAQLIGVAEQQEAAE